MPAARDLSKEKFGRLQPLYPTDKRKNKSIVWMCRCDCGTEKEIPAYVMTGGKVKSCGCLSGGKPCKDLLGKKFGNLEVIRKTEERKGSAVVWECRCGCGNVVLRSSADLKKGRKQSCGCLKKQDIRGKRFGNLVAKKPTTHRKNGYVMWECLCDCGEIVYVDLNSLRNNRVKGHGCSISISSGQNAIKEYLDSIGIKYLMERETLKCVNPDTGYIMPYDFEIPEKKVIIEVQGDQHKQFVKWFHTDMEGFYNQKRKDAYKKKYAEDRGYQVIEIWYSDIYNDTYKENLNKVLNILAV